MNLPSDDVIGISLSGRTCPACGGYKELLYALCDECVGELILAKFPETVLDVLTEVRGVFETKTVAYKHALRHALAALGRKTFTVPPGRPMGGAMKKIITEGEAMTLWSLLTHARLLLRGLNAVNGSLHHLLEIEVHSDDGIDAWNAIQKVLSADGFSASSTRPDHAHAKEQAAALLETLGVRVELDQPSAGTPSNPIP